MNTKAGTKPRRAYEAMREVYWEAQQAFRDCAIEEMRSRMPEGVRTLVFELDETPRLALADMLDADGNSVSDDFGESPEWHDIDQIAYDMELTDWYEAKSLLLRRLDADGEPTDEFVVTA